MQGAAESVVTAESKGKFARKNSKGSTGSANRESAKADEGDGYADCDEIDESESDWAMRNIVRSIEGQRHGEQGGRAGGPYAEFGRRNGVEDVGTGEDEYEEDDGEEGMNTMHEEAFETVGGNIHPGVGMDAHLGIVDGGDGRYDDDGDGGYDDDGDMGEADAGDDCDGRDGIDGYSDDEGDDGLGYAAYGEVGGEAAAGSGYALIKSKRHASTDALGHT